MSQTIADELRASIDHSSESRAAVARMFRDLVREFPADNTEAGCVELLAILEEIKSATAAAQMRQAVSLRELRLTREAAEGTSSSMRGKGLEIALARRESPQSGSRFLGMARLMDADMPHATAALNTGEINEFTAMLLVKQLVPLPSETCRAVATALAPQYGDMGTKRLIDTARAISNQVDPLAQIARFEKALSERRVSVHPAADGMSFLNALLPTPQAFACKKALQEAAATARAAGDTPFVYGTPEQIAAASGVSRSGAQMEADILVERLTGLSSASALPIELHVVMTDAAVFGVSRADARRADASRAEHEITTAAATSEFPDPTQASAPFAAGGRTNAANGTELCARCNDTKELPGWRHTRHRDPDQLTVTTPTGHHRTSTPPPIIPRL